MIENFQGVSLDFLYYKLLNNDYINPLVCVDGFVGMLRFGMKVC